ncbi:hypothetical protein KR009_005676 [Drosophila setifemur]|nr:hypothetical protein KR009_005676 [Drosophila setifemur]
MSDLAFLNTLPNRDLLAKCLEHGLPGVPVTDSTRSVIVRRLHAAITGTPLNKSNSSTKKPPSRRVTVHGRHVAKPTSEPVRRTPGKSPSRVGNISSNSRRTIAYGLDNTSHSGRSVETTTTVSDVGSQSEDDDSFMVEGPSALYPHATQSQDEKHLRRSVSLTKSGVLTTSYTRETGIPPYGQQEETEEDVPHSYTYKRPQIPTVPFQTLPTYEPKIEPLTYRRTELGFSRPLLSQSQLNSTSYKEQSGLKQSTSPISPRNTFSGSARPFGGPSPEPSAGISRQHQNFPVAGISMARGRILQPTTTVNTLYPQLNQFYDQPNNAHGHGSMDSESDSEVEEPLIRSNRISSPLARPKVRKPLVGREVQVSPMSQFQELLKSLDRQYNLRFYFLLIMTVMLATSVYVMMTPSSS